MLETAEAPVRLYSDAVASRPPSSREENYLSPIEARDSRADEDIRPITDANEDTSEESEDSDPRWTTVRRRRAHSLDSTKKNLRNKELIYLSKTLSAEQEEVVKAAVNLLTDEQKEQVVRRQDKIVLSKETDNEPGASRSKGKTVDPREWGNVGIDHRELDPELQAAILEMYEKTCKKREVNGDPKIKRVL